MGNTGLSQSPKLDAIGCAFIQFQSDLAQSGAGPYRGGVPYPISIDAIPNFPEGVEDPGTRTGSNLGSIGAANGLDSINQPSPLPRRRRPLGSGSPFEPLRRCPLHPYGGPNPSIEIGRPDCRNQEVIRAALGVSEPKLCRRQRAGGMREARGAEVLLARTRVDRPTTGMLLRGGHPSSLILKCKQTSPSRRTSAILLIASAF